MERTFEFYWRWFGLPLSRLKGGLVDGWSWSPVEVLVWIGLGMTLVLGARSVLFFIGLFLPGARPAWPRIFNLLSIILGPLLLFALAGGQGALPFSPFPTGIRPALQWQHPPPQMKEEVFRQSLTQAESLFTGYYHPPNISSSMEREWLTQCNLLLDSVLLRLGFPAGRTVRRIKPLTGLRRILGLSYGGPAYHDPLTGEVALVRKADLPAVPLWRLQAICHETVHAKGFGRELDAEILTLLALLSSPDSTFQAAGYQLWLKKSGQKTQWPSEYLDAVKQAAAERKRALQNQPWVRRLKSIARKLSLQNTAEKYGDRKTQEPWDPDDPYYATTFHLLEKLHPHHPLNPRRPEGEGGRTGKPGAANRKPHE